MKRRILFFIMSMMFAGCTTPPATRTYESGSLHHKALEEGLRRPIEITDGVVVLDARAPFDFAVAHAPSAINVQWTDFTERGPVPGLLKKDTYTEARRLARMGIGPDSRVVVLDHGTDGNGEGGRLAWTLLYYGVRNVQLARFDKVGLRFSNITPQPNEAVQDWIPKPVESVLVDKKILLNKLKGARPSDFRIIDVRSKNEYFSKNKKLNYELPDLGALHIEWKEFFTSDGRPNPQIKNQLRAIGVNLNDQILVISNNGVRSGAVTYALLSMGFQQATNYAGGYSDLIRGWR